MVSLLKKQTTNIHTREVILLRTIIGFEDLGKASLEKDAIYEGGNSSVSLRNDPLSKLFKLEGFKRGIGNQSGFRKSNREKNGKSTKEHAFVIIKDSQIQSEWPNQYMKDAGTFIYYGDNREPGKHYLDTKQRGNAFLKEVFTSAYKSEEDRKKIPPIFVFRSTGSHSDIQYLGLAVPGIKGKGLDESLQLRTFEKDGGTYQNYIAHFTILETPFIHRNWLSDLKDATKDALVNAPDEWKRFIKEGIEGVKLPERFLVEEHEIIITEHEKEYEVRMRKTQKIFRDKLLKNDCKCKICGLNIRDLLTASHIKPWKVSDNIEKLDLFNGFLLCPNHDALFDKGFISFSDSGSILISTHISKGDYEKLNIHPNIMIDLDERHFLYLEWHRSVVFKNDN